MPLFKSVKHSAIAILFAAYSCTAFSAVEMIDRVVAIVDQDVVTQTELDGRINEIRVRASTEGMNLPPDDVIKRQVLDQLVTETLQLAMARRYGIQIDDREILQTAAQFMQSQGWNQDQLLQHLASESKTVNEFREGLRRQLTLRTVSQGIIRQRIRISEQDVDNFLKSADAQFWISPDYRLGHILIPLAQSASGRDVVAAEDKAEQIYQKLKSGANFEELAIAESAGPAALQGGDLGWRKTSDLPTLFAEIAPKLEVGDVAQPARSQAGFHILKLTNKRGDTKQEITETKVRHILVKTSAILNADQAKQKLVDIRQSILEGEDFAEAAKEHSEDIASKLAGGDLGWSRPGMFVPVFERTMASMSVGQISQPFQSQYGWHILQVEERRQEDMTEEALRNKARTILMNRRAEDELQIWLQEMRDEAFIEVKI